MPEGGTLPTLQCDEQPDAENGCGCVYGCRLDDAWELTAEEATPLVIAPKTTCERCGLVVRGYVYGCPRDRCPMV